MVRSKVTHGASNRWLIFLVPYFWRHLLEGRNPEVTRGWVAFESQSRWESQWAPTPPPNVPLRTEGVSCFQYGKKGAPHLLPLLPHPDWQARGKGRLVTSLNAWVLFGRRRAVGSTMLLCVWAAPSGTDRGVVCLRLLARTRMYQAAQPSQCLDSPRFVFFLSFFKFPEII